MQFLLKTLLLALVTYFASTATAGVVPVAGGYQVSYEINLGSGTSNGGVIQDTFIIEWNANNDFNIDYAYTIAAKGKTSISHTINFEPTTALLIGYGLGIPGIGDEKDHLFTFMNATFARQVIGLKWSQAFPGVPPTPRIGHNAMINLLRDAATGNTSALDTLKFFVESEGYQAGFDPTGNFSGIEWTIGAPIGIPTLSIYGLGITVFGLLMLASRRITRALS